MPTRYYMEGITTDVLQDVTITCTPSDFVRFLPPPNSTCLEYAGEFVQAAKGYLNNPNATQPEYCEYCQYAEGADYYRGFVGWDEQYMWRDLGIVVCFWFFSILCTIVLTWVNRKAMR